MAYYPKSQITTNLYSNQEFVILETQELYTGYYWKNSSGQFFTGKTPQDLPTREIVPISNNSTQTDDIGVVPSLDALEYNSVTNTNNSIGLVPLFFQTKPTQQDYEIGEFRRYFCKKTNEILYIEISKGSYDLLLAKDSRILWPLYFPFNIPWQLTGDKQQAYNTNRNIVELTSQQLQLPKFGDYLRHNYLKYYR
jgi:hypothetical protein